MTRPTRRRRAIVSGPGLAGWLWLAGCSGSPSSSSEPPPAEDVPRVAAVHDGDGGEGGKGGARGAAAAGEDVSSAVAGDEAEAGEAAEDGTAVAAKTGEAAAEDGTAGAAKTAGPGAGDGTRGAAKTGEAGAGDGQAGATSSGATKSADDRWLAERLAAHPKIARLMKDPARYRLQVLVTVISPKGAPGPAMVEHGYRVDAEYVYPASAIKTFASVAALRKLEALRQEGHAVGLDTPLAYCEGKGRSLRCQTQDESNVEDGTITLGHEIRKMQLVSNNISFNRLYEFVGHRELNEDMWSLGFGSLRIHHRMYGVHDPLVQRTTPRVELRPTKGPSKGKKVVVPARVSDLVLPPTEAGDARLGVGYIDDATGERVDEPLDFAGKNYVSVRDLHRLTLALNRPDLPGAPDLGLTEADRKFLLQAMIEDPLTSKNPIYTDPHDSGLRYHTLIKGMMTVLPLERIHYAGKAGRAYGFHLDNAYIEDVKSGRAMVVTVVAYANANGVLNDNEYEYDGITRPLLKALGEVLGRVLLGEGP